MGLMYVFPVSTDETDFAIKKDNDLVLKTYGLPYIFWFYALCVIAIIFFMFLAIKEPVLKLVSLGDDTDAMLGYALLSFIGLLPVVIMGFFFYEKRIIASKGKLSLQHRIFGISFFTEHLKLDAQDRFQVDPFLTSPNVARLKDEQGTKGFQNKGYFVLWLYGANDKKIYIDRHSRKVDLEKLKQLLESVV